jgi:hypothetical protein
MKHLKMLGLAAIAAAFLIALATAGPAQATVLCTAVDTPACASGHTYVVGTELHLSQKSGASIRFTSGETTVTTCTGNTIKGKTANTGSSTEALKLPIEFLTWSGCSETVDTLRTGELSIQWIKGTHGATVKGTGIEWTLSVSGISCTYSFGDNILLGTLTGGEEPTLTIAASAKKVAGGASCPTAVEVDDELVLTEPHAIYVVSETGSAYDEGILCKSTTTPCANAYGKETMIDTDLTGSSAFESGGSTIAICTGGALKAKTENDGANTEAVSAVIETLSWSGCSQTTTTIAKGSLELRRIAGTENGTVLGKNTQVTLGILGTSCTYGFGEESDLGTLTGKESPVIDISTEIPKTAGGFTCPASVKWMAEYKLTEPAPLYVEATEEGTLCKSTTTPCASSFSKETTVDADLTSSFAIESGGGTFFTCTGGTVKGNIPTLGGKTEAFALPLEALTWTGCSQTTKTLSVGELEVKRIEGTENGTVFGKRTEVTFLLGGVVTCTYGFGESTDLGTLTGGSEPALTISTTVARVAGSTLLCPSTATWTASYKFTKPAPLYLEPV